jgi:competence protein ComEA
VSFVSFFVLFASTARAQKLPEGPGRETFQSVCSLCHSVAGPMGKQWTRSQWDAKITEMLQEEADVTIAERAAIAEYLSANFKPGGKIYINDVAAKDLVTLLDIPTDAADAIAKYRDTHGRFKSVDDLAKVPGIDTAKIAAKKDRLEF